MDRAAATGRARGKRGAAMIHLSMPNLLFVPFLFTLVLLFAAGLYYAARFRAPRVKASHTRIYRCSVCRHVYVDARDVPLARCPRCGCLNEAVKR
jgi:hypothetical protein